MAKTPNTTSSGGATGASPTAAPAAVTGVQLMQGIGVRASRGFWAEAWSVVFKRKAAVAALGWLGIVAIFAVFAPILASGHPLWATWTESDAGQVSASPLWQNLAPLDVLLIVMTLAGVGMGVFSQASKRAGRIKSVIAVLALAIVVLAISDVVRQSLERSAIESGRASLSGAQAQSQAGQASDSGLVRSQPLVRQAHAGIVIGAGASAAVVLVSMIVSIGTLRRRLTLALLGGAIATSCLGLRWVQPLQNFNYTQREADGTLKATYTLIPWSPGQRYSDLQRKPPMTSFGEARGLEPSAPPATRKFMFGTDAFGTDVLTQILHACRLSISIGVVSTMIALVIGVTMGAMMGYFGGWVDLLLFRVVEIFMAVPVLFLLIVAVAVLPDELKTTYSIMAIIGCFTWTGMARYTRAEFMKLRNQDFVQAAEATGLPLRSILFRHMLPNGVAPVLVDTSFAIAAAISVEAVLSYLGLGPVDSPSWGKLLSSAVSQEGEFKWWLAVFPGAAIFLTVLSYNFVGEALRDAIDPKLKKARV